jgi:hypothetical protein
MDVIRSSTAQLHDSLGTRRACACSGAGLSSRNGDSAWGVCYGRAAFCCAFFLWEKGLNAKYIHREMFPVYGWKCLSRKAVHNWVEKFSQGRSKLAGDETEVRKWLRQQSKDFYATGFDSLVKRRDMCISGSGGYVKKFFFQVRISHVLPFISICDLFIDSPLYFLFHKRFRFILVNCWSVMWLLGNSSI